MPEAGTILLLEREVPYALRRDRAAWLRGAVRRVAEENPGSPVLVPEASLALLGEPLPGPVRPWRGAPGGSGARRAYLLYNTLNRMDLLADELALLRSGIPDVRTLEPAPLAARARNSAYLKSGTHAERKGLLDVNLILDSYREKVEAFDPREALDPADYSEAPLTWARLAPLHLFGRLRKLALLRILWRRLLYHALLAFWASWTRLRRAPAFAPGRLEAERGEFGPYLDALFHMGGRVIRTATEGRHFSRLGLEGPSLEVGVDDGTVSRLHFRGRRLTVGVEYDPAVLFDSREEVSRVFEHAVAGGDLYRLPFRDGAFRTVALVHIMDHLERIEPVLAELSRVLAPGGTLAFSTFSERYGRLSFTDAALRPLGLGAWLDRRREAHCRRLRIYNLLSPPEWAALLERNGLEPAGHAYFTSAPLSRIDGFLSQELCHSIGPIAASNRADTPYRRGMKRLLGWLYFPYYAADESLSARHGGMNVFVLARKPGPGPGHP